MSEIMDIQVEEWVHGYIAMIFAKRGYIDSDSKVILKAQMPDWIRLMVESGLAQNKKAADQVAYDFSFVDIKGGKGKIFEAFASFLNKEPASVREFYEERATVAESKPCDICETMGIVMIPMENIKTGEVNDKAFSCSCSVGRVKFGGVPAASPEMLDYARRKNAEEAKRLGQYMHNRGVAHRSSFTSMFVKINDHLRGKKQNEMNARRELVHAQQSEEESSLLIYENGDERGWFDE